MAIRMTMVRRTIPHRGKEAPDVTARMAECLGRTLGIDVVWGNQIGGDVGVLYMYADFDNMAELEAAGSIWANDEWNDLYAESEHCLEMGHSTIVYLQ